MYLDFDDHRPETPRVPQAFTRLERVLLAVVAYQFLLLVYFLAPDSLFVKPVKQFLAPDEPIRYVDIQPLVDRAALAKLMAPPSDMSRRSTSPTPARRPARRSCSSSATPRRSPTCRTPTRGSR